MPKLIEKRVGMSREDFDRLPPLISRKEFLFCTGLEKDDFYIMVETKRIRRLPVGRSGKIGRYYKHDAGVIAGYYTNNEVKNGV
jgi:hypothetical protein